MPSPPLWPTPRTGWCWPVSKFPQKPQNQPSAEQSKRNDAAKAQLNREGGFPLAVVVAPDGQILGKIGYVGGGPAGFEAYLNTLLGK